MCLVSSIASLFIKMVTGIFGLFIGQKIMKLVLEIFQESLLIESHSKSFSSSLFITFSRL